MDAKTQERSPVERIPVIFVSGPYRARTEQELYENIAAARAVAVEILRLGAMPICPHLNTAWMGGVVPDEMILDGYLEVFGRCDGLVALERWASSKGSTDELHRAQKLHKPVCVVSTACITAADSISNQKLRDFVLMLKGGPGYAVIPADQHGPAESDLDGMKDRADAMVGSFSPARMP